MNLIAASALALGLFAAPEVPASMPLLAASTRHEPGSTPIVSARREESGEGASDTLRFSPDDESDEEDDRARSASRIRTTGSALRSATT